MKYPGGEHHGKTTDHVLFHEHTGAVVGHGKAEDGLIGKHGGAEREPHKDGKRDHYSDAEKKNWIAGAIKHPGALTKKAKAAGESPMAFAKSHEGASGKTGKQARLAITLSHLHKK